MLTIPQKFNADRQDKITKQKYRVTNWADYNESLRQRGDLTVWISEEGLRLWSAPRRTSRGGQQKYSDLEIEICLTLGAVLKQALRPTQGLMRSIAACDRGAVFLYPLAPRRGPDFARDAQNGPI
jgi:hypothetical protein